jgi:hypothetical protein
MDHGDDGLTAAGSRREDIPPRKCFDAFNRSFQSARERLGPVTRSIRVAGHRIRLCFAGDRMARTFLPALDHLSVAPDESPELTVHLWDSAASGIRRPAMPLSPSPGQAGGNVWRMCRDGIRLMVQPEESLVSLLDEERNEAILWTADAGGIPYYVRCAPLITIFQWWMSRHGRYVVHAGAVGTAGGGVLLAGRAGSGKSSAALACVGSGLRFAGDDYCLVSMADIPRVHSLYSSGKLNGEDVAVYPGLAPAQVCPERPGGAKATYFLHAAFPDSLSSGFPVRAVILPRVTPGATTRLRETTGAAALLALAPSTMFQLREAEAETFQMLGQIVRQVPCFILEMGANRADIPRRISALLETIAHGH